MRAYASSCASCGERGPVRSSRTEAKTAFRGHYCPTVTSYDDGSLIMARRAVRHVTRGRRLDALAWQEAFADALYGIALARVRHDPDLGPWDVYATNRAVGAVRDGFRDRAPIPRTAWARGARDASDLPAPQRPCSSIEGLREEYGWDAGASDPLLEFVGTREYVRWLLDLVEGREREVLVRSYLQGHTLAQIASWWRVTESRVCQVRASALARVRARAFAVEDPWARAWTAS